MLLRFARYSLATLLILSTFNIARSDEGMWPLYELDRLPFDSLEARGLILKPNEIFNPEGTGVAGAVVQVGATGSFVSPNGLIVTNHHVAYGAIQKQSSVEQNYLRDGFYAPTYTDEIPALDYRVSVTLAIQDVTDKIIKAIPKNVGDLERYQAIDKKTKEIIKETEKKGDVRCRVATFFGGKQYMLYTFLEIKDVRIVYVPPEAIGKYGGDIDNWMWPRHTGDFSFLRAYVSPEGKSAAYAKENVPYHPKVFLPISSKGIKEGDFSMTLGFPGGTERYLSSYEIADQLERSYPRSISTTEDELKIIYGAGEKDSAIALRLASDVAGLNNSLKNRYGTLEGFKRGNILAKKRDDERGLSKFLAADPTLQNEYGRVLPELDSLFMANQRSDEKDYVLSRMNWSCDYLSMASTIFKWSIEREKSDLERERRYQNRDTADARERLKHAQINLVPSVDQEKLKYYINRALRLPAGQRITAIDAQFAGKTGPDLAKAIEQYVDALYAGSKIGNLEARMNMFDMKKSELEKLNDPFINLAIALRPDLDERIVRDKTFSGALIRLMPKLIQAYAEWKKTEMYPDANGTMRLSSGEVEGYHPRDAVSFTYLTNVKGVMEKETGKDPFIVPPELKKAYLDKNSHRYNDAVSGDVPVNFLTTNDITGGNSGSPVLNGKGEMIGIAFDGNWEGVASDYLFNPDVTRTISVDIRYVLYLIDEVYHLDNLLKELTVH